MLEVVLKEPDDFLKVRETLSRMGVASRREKILWQSAHILHKKGRYYIAHFKELFALDGKETNISISDLEVVENKSTGQLNYLYNDNKFLPLYEYIYNGKVINYILPISGKGLWSTLYGFIALSKRWGTL